MYSKPKNRANTNYLTTPKVQQVLSRNFTPKVWEKLACHLRENGKTFPRLGEIIARKRTLVLTLFTQTGGRARCLFKFLKTKTVGSDFGLRQLKVWFEISWKKDPPISPLDWMDIWEKFPVLAAFSGHRQAYFFNRWNFDVNEISSIRLINFQSKATQSNKRNVNAETQLRVVDESYVNSERSVGQERRWGREKSKSKEQIWKANGQNWHDRVQVCWKPTNKSVNTQPCLDVIRS
jgi:hypothetical protein